MSLFVVEDEKINSKYESKEQLLYGAKETKVAKNLISFMKTKQKIIMAKKLLKKNKVTNREYEAYVQKVLKERELSRENTNDYHEIIFESENCILSCELRNGTLVYMLNQHGMCEDFYDLDVAIERYIMLTI